METILLVDGENFKGKMRSVFKDSDKDKPIWHKYNFRGLLDKVLDGIKIDRKIFCHPVLPPFVHAPARSTQLQNPDSQGASSEAAVPQSVALIFLYSLRAP